MPSLLPQHYRYFYYRPTMVRIVALLFFLLITSFLLVRNSYQLTTMASFYTSAINFDGGANIDQTVNISNSSRDYTYFAANNETETTTTNTSITTATTMQSPPFFSIPTTTKNTASLPPVPKEYPRFFLAHTEGHTASYSVHKAMTVEGCPWTRHFHGDDYYNTTATATATASLLDRFERTAPGERRWKHGTSNTNDSHWATTNNNTTSTTTTFPFLIGHERSCRHAERKLLPYLHKYTHDNWKRKNNNNTKSDRDTEDLSNVLFMDLGHFHARGHVTECLAKILQNKLILVRIRRNRHQVANSFVSKSFVTPCLRDHEQLILPAVVDSNQTNDTKKKNNRKSKKLSPGMAICPRSGEHIGPTYLPVPGGDAVWDTVMTPFQRFLWYVDEMEYRWHVMQNHFREQPFLQLSSSSPTFLEVSWSTQQQLHQGTNRIRTSLGCTTLPSVPMSHNHTRHQQIAAINCTDYIVQDWDYQRIMQYSMETRQILFLSSHREEQDERNTDWLPLHLDSDKCAETKEELETFIKNNVLRFL